MTAGGDNTANTHSHTHKKPHTHTVCSTDTAAISYQLSRLTAGEKETDGKERRIAINTEEEEEME